MLSEIPVSLQYGFDGSARLVPKDQGELPPYLQVALLPGTVVMQTLDTQDWHAFSFV